MRLLGGPDSPPTGRAVADLTAAAVASAVTWASLGVGSLPLILGLGRLAQGHLVAGAIQVILGMAFVGALAVLVARPLAAATLRRTGRRTTRTGWWDGRSLAWLAVTLTIRSSVAATAGLTIIGALVAMVSPALAHNGDRVDIGPWHIDAMPSAIGAALCGAVLLAAVSLLAPAVATADQHLMDAVLIGDRDRLESQLEHTSSSRTRLVNAFDLERRRIERDLHDGIQPELLGISMTLGIALTTMGDHDPARQLVATAQQQSLDTLEDLRRFVRGIHPQVLDDHGLTAALAELAATLPVTVHIDDQLRDRLDSGTEAALYYAGAELLTNAAKHAQAVECRVTLRTRTHGAPTQTAERWLEVTVTDDGHGGADPRGRGLTGVQDRMEALGGRLHISSPIGGPTAITLTIPQDSPRPR